MRGRTVQPLDYGSPSWSYRRGRCRIGPCLVMALITARVILGPGVVGAQQPTPAASTIRFGHSIVLPSPAPSPQSEFAAPADEPETGIRGGGHSLRIPRIAQADPDTNPDRNSDPNSEPNSEPNGAVREKQSIKPLRETGDLMQGLPLPQRSELATSDTRDVKLPNPRFVKMQTIPGAMNDTGFQRDWPMTQLHWEASRLKRMPTYFEDPELNRYGNHQGAFQPVVSAARFYGTIPLVPFKAAHVAPYECIYDLGYARPGSPESFPGRSSQEDCQIPQSIHQSPRQPLSRGAYQPGIMPHLSAPVVVPANR